MHFQRKMNDAEIESLREEYHQRVAALERKVHSVGAISCLKFKHDMYNLRSSSGSCITDFVEIYSFEVLLCIILSTRVVILTHARPFYLSPNSKSFRWTFWCACNFIIFCFSNLPACSCMNDILCALSDDWEMKSHMYMHCFFYALRQFILPSHWFG